LDKKNAELVKVGEEIETMNANKKKTTDKIETLREQLREARIGKKETERDAKFREALDSMKRLFPGVKGRLNELCAVSYY
jgi:structural maintenance of chromosome 1